MKKIALKIEVDTWHGAKNGVPALLEILQKHQARATFFVSLGADKSGQEKRADSLKRFYPFATRFAGELLPAPRIGKSGAKIFKSVQEAGFELGIRAWNRVLWESAIFQATNEWVEAEMKKAILCFTEIFGLAPKAHAAAGFRMNRHALRMSQSFAFNYASDSLGTCPFIPVIDGEIVLCPQIPTTLPTLDVLLEGDPKNKKVDLLSRLIEETEKNAQTTQVFTLRAEIEGGKFKQTFEDYLIKMTEKGYQFISLGEFAKSLEIKNLPRHHVKMAEIAGRKGIRMTQGDIFP